MNNINILLKRKRNKLSLSVPIFVIINILIIGLVPTVFAEASPWPAFNVCCEKTQQDAWCINTLEENCDNNFRITPTSCETTSFCSPGCCYDSSEGLCMENTPEKVCNDGGGTWDNDAECNIPQCDLGCCVLGTQASFVTLTRCKKLSSDYGLEADFRKNILDEASCINFAAGRDEGACVYESDFDRTCRFTSRQDCLGSEQGNQTSEAEFFKDYLCSAPELATNCGQSEKTTCVDGKQEVYFLDTCGNTANIYDASKKDNDAYWEKKIDKSDSCGYNDQDGNADSRTCGNCDYFQGSICSEGSAELGDYACNDLNCYNTENGQDYKNGESWCVFDSNLVGEGRDPAGSRHFRHVCMFGEETIEACADFRNEVCLENTIESQGESFNEAACRINRWPDCIDQKEEDDCLNTDKRDCFWYPGYALPQLETTNRVTGNVVAPITGRVFGEIFGGKGSKDEILEEGSGIQPGNGICLPDVTPGLKFWQSGEAETICELGNSECVVVYEKGLISEKKCKENCECLEQSWRDEMNEICVSLGDCGEYINFVGKEGGDNIDYKIGGKRQETKSGSETFSSTRDGGFSGTNTGGFSGGLKSNKPIGVGILQTLFNYEGGKNQGGEN